MALCFPRPRPYRGKVTDTLKEKPDGTSPVKRHAIWLIPIGLAVVVLVVVPVFVFVFVFEFVLVAVLVVVAVPADEFVSV